METMILKPELADGKAKFAFIEEQVKLSTNEYLNSILNTIYPLRIVKRFIFRPYLGHWYPYMDVSSPGYDFQLSLFYGKINFLFSKEKICSLCNIMLNDNNSINNLIPVSLCSDCFSKVYLRYWNCLKKIYESAFLDIEGIKSSGEQMVCKNLLFPECGYPMNTEKTNPCLKNHAIGLVMLDDSTLKVMIGLLETIKYQMIREGGLVGIILGYSNRIMNLEILEKILSVLYYHIIYFIDKYNSSHGQGKVLKQLPYLDDHAVKLYSNHSSSPVGINKARISQWILINFFRYYNDFEKTRFIFDLMKRPLNFLKFLIEHLLTKVHFDIEILQFVDLYKTFIPFNFNLRKYCEKLITNILELNRITEFSRAILKNLREPFISDGANWIRQFFMINFKNSSKELEIKDVSCALGRFLIVSSNFSEAPALLDINDLIGRKIL